MEEYLKDDTGIKIQEIVQMLGRKKKKKKVPVSSINLTSVHRSNIQGAVIYFTKMIATRELI